MHSYCIFNCYCPTNIISNGRSSQNLISYKPCLTTGRDLVRNIIVNFKGAYSQHCKEKLRPNLITGLLLEPSCKCINLCLLCPAHFALSVKLLSRIRGIFFDMGLICATCILSVGMWPASVLNFFVRRLRLISNTQARSS